MAKSSKKKTWTEKLNHPLQGEVTRTSKKFADIPPESKMYISYPQEINQYVLQIPKGKSIEVQTIRKDLAAEHHAEYTCPVTTGIFLRIVAEAAYEAHLQGKSIDQITPFWRAIPSQSPLAKKISCGPDFLAHLRQAEGIIDKPQRTKSKKA